MKRSLVGSESVTGSGFPTGKIPPANVTVTLQPSIKGGGPGATTTATSVDPVSGGNLRITFVIPGAIAVSDPTANKVTIAGSDAAGLKFESRNSSALTVNPPSQITAISPNAANAALTHTVNITGLYTNFVQGTTVASATAAVAQIAIEPVVAVVSRPDTSIPPG